MSTSGDERPKDLDNEDPYAIVSETTDEDDFVKVWENEHDESFLELPKEDDGTILISTLQGQFPNAVGLRYKSSSGGWRGVRISEGVLNPPHGGWGDTEYFVTLQKSDSTKPVAAESTEKSTRSVKGEPSDREFLQDLFVLHLSRDTTDDDLKEYFTKSCGDMALSEVKYNRQTGTSRGFGFIRFKTADAAKEALNGDHIIHGQKLEVRISRKKESPCQLFVGRLPEGTSNEDLSEYFGSFGELTEAYITTPFRGFGFITYASTDTARSVLRMKHEIKGARLNLAVAEPKEEKFARRNRRDSRVDDRGPRHRDNDDRDRSRGERRYDPRRSSRRDSPPRRNDMMDEFRNMLFEVIGQGRR